MGGEHSAEAQQLDLFQRWEEMRASKGDNEMNLSSGPPIHFREVQRWAKASCKIILGRHSWGSGCFVVFRIHENDLHGVMTNNHVLDESRLEDKQNVRLRLHNAKEITVQLMSTDGIRFTCPLLDVTFIELSEADVSNLKRFDHDVNFLEVCSSSDQCITPETADIAVMQYPQNHETNGSPQLSYAQGKVFSLWGSTCILHDASTDYGSSGSGIVSVHSGEVVAIHCARRPDMEVNVGVRAPVAIRAIEKVIKRNIAHHKPAKDLDDDELQSLEALGLLRTDNKFLFKSSKLPFRKQRRLWFYRTNHAWYWTRTKPGSHHDIEKLRRCNWHEVGVDESIIGGHWNGKKLGQRNIRLIVDLYNCSLSLENRK